MTGQPIVRGDKRVPGGVGPATGAKGFTLIEIITVISIIAILASIAIPMFRHSVTRAKEAALLENLFQMRDAIDKYYADQGEYPMSLSSLVAKKYTRKAPVDPFTGADDTWSFEYDEDGGIFDVHSGSELVGRNGIPYGEW